MTNRVAGFICKHVFTEHSSCVTGLAVVGREAGYNTTYLVRLACKVKYVAILKLRGVGLFLSAISVARSGYEYFYSPWRGYETIAGYSLLPHHPSVFLSGCPSNNKNMSGSRTQYNDLPNHQPRSQVARRLGTLGTRLVIHTAVFVKDF